MLTKEQLIEKAQPHADASFTAPSDPTKHYTAWASMKTLIEKNLVYGRGRPKRYCLTEAGDEIAAATVAEGDLAATGGPANGNGRAESREPSSRAPGQNARVTAASRGASANRPPSRPGGAPPRLGGVMPLADSDDEEDFRRIAQRAQGSRAQSRESPGSVNDLAAQRNRLQALYSGRSLEYGKDRPNPREGRSIPWEKPCSSFIDIEDLTDSPLPTIRQSVLRTSSKSSSNIQSANNASTKQFLPLISPVNKPPVLVSLPETRIALAVSSQYPQPLQTRSHSVSVQLGPPTRSKSIQLDLPTFPFFVPEVLQPSTFTIQLLLDNREVRAKHDRDYIANTLSSSGVAPITRSLAVGDIMWIAHEHAAPHREIVLDYIVERKRLDDLVASIKDGRFHDQKFRLAKSGVKNVVYIIEDYSMGTVEGPMQEAIDTAISSMQVVNGFFVKKTAKLDDTIRYLVRMTKMLEGVYSVSRHPNAPSPNRPID